MYRARLILSVRDSVEVLDSSKIIIWESTPVPMAAMIPAMAGRSRFLANRAETPRMMRTSERLVSKTARESFMFLYLIRTTIPTARIAASPARKIVFMNSLPRSGLIVSSFSICNLKGRDPEISTVWSCFIWFSASSYASSLVKPVPDPEI